MNWGGGRPPEGLLIDHHQEYQPVLEYFRVNAAIKEALKPRVDLPSGGYVIIEPTEALTVIDVNSGSFTRSATARETVLWTNSEAATEIARQLRLRNIGGVIIVDFIDMDSRRDQLKLLEHFNKVLRGDKARPQIAQLSELGLVELTRKRQGKNIYELFGQPCAHCGGLGHLVRLPGQSEGLMLSTYSSPSATWRPPEKPYLEPEVLTDSAWESLPEEEALEMEFLNHPNYQEQGGAVAANRRRRRRVKDGGREELIFPVVAPPEQPISEIESSAPILQLDRKDRSLSRTLTRRDEAPVEKVSLEMTELEQDVYALMGVSPLIRLDRKFKDTRSVVITVTLPGESSAVEGSPQEGDTEEAQPETLEIDLEEETVSLPEGGEETTSAPRIRIKPESKAKTESSAILSIPLSLPETTEPLQMPLPGLESQEESEAEKPESKAELESGVVRRRRRRSSAAGSEES
jgi:ribonuclease E